MAFISNTAQNTIFDEVFNDAWDHFKNGRRSKAKEVAQWLLQRPAAPPYQKIGARYLVERCRYESAAAARKALKRYQAMETKTEDDLKYKSDRINELEDILKEIVQMQKEVAEKRAREKEPKSCFTAAEIALPTQEQQPGTWQWALPKM